MYPFYVHIGESKQLLLIPSFLRALKIGFKVFKMLLEIKNFKSSLFLNKLYILLSLSVSKVEKVIFLHLIDN